MPTDIVVATIDVAFETEEVIAGLYCKPMGIFAMYFACLPLHVPQTLLGSVSAFQDTAKKQDKGAIQQEPYLFQIDSWFCQ